jgi:hypothetical protein
MEFKGVIISRKRKRRREREVLPQVFQRKTKIIFYTIDIIIVLLTMIFLLLKDSPNPKDGATIVAFILFCVSLMLLVEAFVFKLYRKHRQKVLESRIKR